MIMAAPTDRVQIAVNVVSKGANLRATVKTGEHTGAYVTIVNTDYRHDAHIVAARALVAKVGLTGAITYAGTTSGGGTVYNVAV
jgi:copper(I)-binding protein